MKVSYKIINASVEEEDKIRNIIDFILKNYYKKINIDMVKKIEVVDELYNSSSAKSIKDTMIISRNNGLNNAKIINGDFNLDEIDIDTHMLISTIYHELWHISSWKKYEEMCEYVLDENDKDLYTSFAYMYWIEYLAHVETCFIENKDVSSQFCVDFVKKEWHKIEFGYSYYVKELPYYLVRSNYLGIFEELTKKITCTELKMATYEFDKISKELLCNKEINDLIKANKIRNLIKKLFE